MLVYPLFIGTWEIVIICLIVLLMFGGKKIPELMKGLGKGVKSFKEGINEIDEQVNQVDVKPEESKKLEGKKDAK